MHNTQLKILNFSDRINVKKHGLRQIGRLIDEPHPFNISYHLKKLEESGFVKINRKTGVIKRVKRGEIEKGIFIAVPVLGGANCGEPSIFAHEQFEGFIKISKKIISNGDGIIAIRAYGNSMNKSDIKGKNIEDGDYVIVDTKVLPGKNDSGKYVLAIIDNCASIKKYIMDNQSKDRISLVSESTEKHPDIFIHKDDLFLINGVVIDVLKK